MRFVKDNIEIELHDENTFSIAIRAGFTPVKEGERVIDTIEDDHASLVKKAKALGIKSAHLMKEETLREKITELTTEL